MAGLILREDCFYSCLLNQNILNLFVNCSSDIPNQYESTFRYILYKRTNYRQINHNNRRNIWMQIFFPARGKQPYEQKDLFDFKYDGIFGDNSFLAENIVKHNCFEEVDNSCCIQKWNQLYSSLFTCSSPFCCGDKTRINFLSCCLFYTISRRTLDILLTSDPNISHLTFLSHISHIFTMVFDQNYQVYSCLMLLLSNDRFFFVDKTITKAHVSSAILRYLLKNLCRYMFHSHEITHPWIKILYNTNPYFFPEYCDIPWCFNDWQSLLFQNITTCDLLTLMDAYILRGAKEFYKLILFYFAVMLKRMNSKKMGIKCTLPYSHGHVIANLKSIIQENLNLSVRNKFYRKILKLRVTNKNINKYYQKLFPLVVKCPPLSPFIRNIKSDLYFTFDQPSEILNYNEWKQLVSWLPERVQLLSPSAVYSSNSDGWSLKTLYTKTEHYEPILLLIKTECDSIFGCFLTQSLSTRNENEHINLSFGNGEVFIFSMRPEVRRHNWVTLDSPSFESRSTMVFSTNTSPKLISQSTYKKFKRYKNIFKKKDHNHGESESFNHDTSITEMIEDIKSSFMKHHQSSPDPYIETKRDIFIVANDSSLCIGGGGDGYAIWLDETLSNGSSRRCSTFLNEPFVSHPHGYFKSINIEVFKFVDNSFT